MCEKCEWPDGISFRPDGVNELDPCLYEDVESIYISSLGITIIVSKCVRCGNIDVSYIKDYEKEN